MKPVKLALVGIGRMGHLHLKTCSKLPRCFSLVAMVDSNSAIERPVKTDHLAFYQDINAVIGRVNAAIISSPSSVHKNHALSLLEAGIHCLVEKPLAMTIDEIEILHHASKKNSCVLVTGHSERFNPMVEFIQKQLLDDVSEIIVKRLSTVAIDRQFDLDVSKDLLIHDIDWIMQWFGRTPDEIIVKEYHQIKGTIEEIACLLRFHSQCNVHLHVSRVAPNRERTVTLVKNKKKYCYNLDTKLSSHGSKHFDPLLHQALAFYQTIHGKQTKIAVASEAKKVMSIVEEVDKQCA